jgi:thioredoxin 1
MRTILLALLASLFPLHLAMAAGQPFEQSRFDALQRAGRPILVWIHADWCPTCRAQDKALRQLLPRPDLQGLTVLKVDFDRQKPLVHAFHAIQQSTFILFKGGREVARSLGETRRGRILAFLKQAM